MQFLHDFLNQDIQVDQSIFSEGGGGAPGKRNFLFLAPFSINELELNFFLMVNPFPCLFLMEMNQT